MEPNLVIPIGHKIQLTVEKLGPIHAIPTYQIKPTLEKGTHICNTCISNETSSRKWSPSMQHMHIKYNLHWKRKPIHVIPTCQMKPTLEKETRAYNTYKSNEIKPKL
jgi:hypothetical protein